jgi:endonuclease/exonuclease/phosphatase (EEP) superfamily protein YafD
MALIRILSINLLVDRAVPDDLRRVIVDADPDVVCAQELGPTTAAVIADILPNGRLDPRRDLFGLGIASKHPVVVERLVLQDRSGWVARLDPDAWPGIAEPFDVFAVHLINPIDLPWGRTRNTRRRQVSQIAAMVEERDVASVIIGDMNATPSWSEYRLLSKIGTDAAHATGTAQRTWSQFKSGPRLLRIDHAFVVGARPITTSTAAVRGSDHHALIVDIEV